MQVKFFHKDIEKYILSLEKATQAKVLRLLELLQEYGSALGMPYSKALGDGLFELRISGKQNIRILYIFHCSSAVVVHAFVKKQNKIPLKELNIAYERRACIV